MSRRTKNASGYVKDADLEDDEGSVHMPAEVAAVFAGYAPEHRTLLQAARLLIREVASEAGVGPLTETLKWGQPAYLTEKTKAGSTVRLGLAGDIPAVFFICHSGLVEGFQADFPELTYLGARGIALEPAPDEGALALCLRRALTFHWAKREGKR